MLQELLDILLSLSVLPSLKAGEQLTSLAVVVVGLMGVQRLSGQLQHLLLRRHHLVYTC